MDEGRTVTNATRVRQQSIAVAGGRHHIPGREIMNVFGKVIGFLGFVLVALLGSALAAGAQATPEADRAFAAQAGTTDLFVNTVLCEDAACDPATTVDGATIAAFDAASRELIDSCTVVLAAPAGCNLTVPDDPDLYYIEWDETLIPAGYAQAGDPFLVENEPVEPNVLTLGFAPIGTPGPEPVEAPVNVVICDDDCDLPRTLDGAVVTSFDAAGLELDSCTVSSAPDDFDGCLLDMPGDDSGSFEITPPAGTEGYVLRSLEPEYVERVDLRLWTFIPAEAPATEQPADGIPVNVVACDVAGCTDPVTMDGAELVSYQDGEEIDRCVVESEADDFDGCILVIAADEVDVEITPAAPYDDYVLVSDEPDIYEAPERGIYVWTFVPAEAQPTAAPATAEPSAAATAAPVTALPETGAGAGTSASHAAGIQGALVILGSGLMALVVAGAGAGLGVRRARR